MFLWVLPYCGEFGIGAAAGGSGGGQSDGFIKEGNIHMKSVDFLGSLTVGVVGGVLVGRVLVGGGVVVAASEKGHAPPRMPPRIPPFPPLIFFIIAGGQGTAAIIMTFIVFPRPLPLPFFCLLFTPLFLVTGMSK